jgi:integrase
MTVYTRPGSSVYHFEFTIDGERHRGTTGETDKDKARAFEAMEREKVKAKAAQAAAGVIEITMWALAQSWLTASKATHKDHRNNESRVRKLFGIELQQRGRTWVECPGARFGIPKDLMTHQVSQAMLSALKTRRLEEGCKAGTINREMSLLQSLMGFAESLGCPAPLVPIKWSSRNNRAASLKLPEAKGRLRWLTLTEEAAFLGGLIADAEARPNDLAAMDAWHLAQFLIDTGARHTEISTLTWDLIDLERGTINLYRGKVDNESRLNLPSRTLTILRERWDLMKDLGYTCVFPKLRGRTWDGEDVPRGHATSAIQRHLDALGGDRATPHALRHTFASRLLQAGVSLAKVSKLLGHSSIAMTARYAHLADDALHAEAFDVLERLHGSTHKSPLPTVEEEDEPSDDGPMEWSQVVDFEDEKENASGRTCVTRTRDQRIKSPLLYQLS